jgi:hypothetical protein
MRKDQLNQLVFFLIHNFMIDIKELEWFINENKELLDNLIDSFNQVKDKKTKRKLCKALEKRCKSLAENLEYYRSQFL